jgi:hypothetical protein
LSSLVPFLALKHVRRRPLQSILTVVGVAVGVMVLITALSLTNGFIDELIDSTLEATPHVTLRSYQAGGTIAFDPEVLEALQQSAGVVAAAPFLSSQALIARRADRSVGLAGVEGFTQIAGIDPVAEQAVLDLPVLAEAAPLLERGEGIVLGASLAAQLGREADTRRVEVVHLVGSAAVAAAAATVGYGVYLTAGGGQPVAALLLLLLAGVILLVTLGVSPFCSLAFPAADIVVFLATAGSHLSLVGSLSRTYTPSRACPSLCR